MSEIEAVPPLTPRPLRPRPTKMLPTDRIAPAKQWEVLRAIAVLSGPARRPVTLQEVENVIKMKASTLSLVTPFQTDIGLLARADKGYVPSDAVVAFQREYQWDKEKATHKLAPIVQETWFAQRLMPGLSMRAFTEKEAVKELADACGAVPEYEPQLRVLLDYMEAAGLVARENGEVRLMTEAMPSIASDLPPGAFDTVTPDKPAQPPPIAPPPMRVAPQPTTDGIQFSVNVKVDMAEIAGWDPARITAFFAGIAQVLAAKGALDKGAG